MHVRQPRWLLMLCCALGLVLVTGCFQPLGGNLQPTPAGQTAPDAGQGQPPETTQVADPSGETVAAAPTEAEVPGEEPIPFDEPVAAAPTEQVVVDAPPVAAEPTEDIVPFDDVDQGGGETTPEPGAELVGGEDTTSSEQTGVTEVEISGEPTVAETEQVAVDIPVEGDPLLGATTPEITEPPVQQEPLVPPTETPIPEVVSLPTFTLTFTPEPPTATPVPPTATPTITMTPSITLTPTPITPSAVPPTGIAAAATVVDLLAQTPVTATPDSVVFPSPTVPTALPTEIAAVPAQQEIPPELLTVTAIFVQATIDAGGEPPIFESQSDGSELLDEGIEEIPIPTQEEAPVVEEPVDAGTGDTTLGPDALTATAIIETATATAGVPLTLTAIQSGVLTVEAATEPVAAPGEGEVAETPGVTPPPPGADCIHEVRRGENLFRLSLLYGGVTVEDIAIASGVVNVNRIFVAQRLTIPGCGTNGVTPRPTSTPFGDGQGGGGGGAAAGDSNGQGGGGGGLAGGVTHTVRQYETLFEISMRYSVPVATIANANGIANINLIYIGQELTIP